MQHSCSLEKITLTVDQWVELCSSCSDLEIPLDFCVQGVSMLPFIRPFRDFVTVLPAKSAELKVGDIVLFLRDDNYCLHRIAKMDADKVQTFGDGNSHSDNWITPDKIKGRVVLISRGHLRIKCDSFLWRCISRLWVFLLPVRQYLLRIYRSLFL